MSYLPFHHKYRPQTFADLVGQGAAATTLSNALRLGKIAPAYLFTGPRGTGKTSSARILAKSLNCLSHPSPTPDPCGTCTACKAIAQGTALDVVEIDAASNTGVDNIRELIERAQYAPVQCRYKVYTIDECHMLSVAAFNALLKTLEEPPPQVVFILATTDPQRVLPTIISRCQKFDYRRIPLADMVAHLQWIAHQEGISIQPAALQLVAQIAQGGLRDAESLLDQLSLLPDQVTTDRVWELVGTVPEQQLCDLVRAVLEQDLVVLLDRCRPLVEQGKEPLTIVQNLAGFYRDLAIAKAAPHRADLTSLTPEIWPQVQELAQSLDLATLLAAQEHLRESEAQVKNTTQPRLWLEVTLLGLLSQPSPPRANPPQPIAPATTTTAPVTPPVTAPLATTPPPEAIADPPAPAVAQREPAPIPAPVPEAPKVDLPQLWQALLKQLLPSGRGLFEPHGVLLSVTDDRAIVGVKSPTLTKLAEGQKKYLEKALTQILGRPIAVAIQHQGGHSPSDAVAPATKAPASTAATPTPILDRAPTPNLPPVPTTVPTQIAAPSPLSSSSSAASLDFLDEPEEFEAEDPADADPADLAAPASPPWPESPPSPTVAEPPQPLWLDQEPTGPDSPPRLPALRPEPVATLGPDRLEPDPKRAAALDALDAAAAKLAQRFGGEVLTPELAATIMGDDLTSHSRAR